MWIKAHSGLRIHCEKKGKGPLVVLLHPVGTRAAFWAPLMERLAERYRCVAPDLPGHGESDIPDREFTLEDVAGDIVDLIRALGAEKAIVCGCSLGGMLAQSIALSAPDLLRGLVITGAGYTRDGAGRQAVMARAEAARKGMDAVVDTTLDRWFTPEQIISDLPMIRQVRSWLLQADPLAHSLYWQAMAALDHEAGLLRISCPTLAIAAEGDQSVSPAIIKEMARRIPNARFEMIADAGHLAPFERPEEFARLFEQFTRSIAH